MTHFQKGVTEDWKVKYLSNFAPTGPNMEIRPQFPAQRVKFQFCSYQSFADNKAFPKRSH